MEMFFLLRWRHIDSDQLTELDPDDDTSESDEDNGLYSEDDSDSD